MNDLTTQRAAIDAADEKLLAVLAERFKAVDVIGAYKRSHGIPPLDESRWKEVLAARVKRGDELHLDTDFVANLFELIHSYALRREE
jgi:chorismate mutase